MSEPVSALNKLRFNGLVRIEETGLHGMITLRGDFAVGAVKKAAMAAAGTSMPGIRQAVISDTGGLAWMSPDEVLILCPYDEAQARLEKLTSATAKVHALAVNVSDARAMFRISGPAAREVMAKLCPVDLAPDAFGPGDFRRSRLAQVPAAIWMEDEDTFGLICFRSVAQYVFDVLKVAAVRNSEVRYYAV